MRRLDTSPPGLLVEVRRDGGVTWLTLNRPDALNAWTVPLGEELTLALDDAIADDEVRVIVLTGAGRAFSSGADLRGGLSSEGGVPDVRAEGGAPDVSAEGGAPDVRGALQRVYHPLILRVRTAPKPVIAAVNGPAVGIGCSLALAADLIVAARSAYFLMAFVNIGLGLDGGASQTLTARVGHARAFEIAYLGERIDADRALAWGLVNDVVDDAELQTAVAELASRLAAGPPGSYAAIKRTINDRAYAGFAQLLELEAEIQQQRAASHDFAEGVLAFLQKRPAHFTGT